MSELENDTEKWLSELFGELIHRGISSQEHIHYHGSPMGNYSSPTLQELREVHLGYTGEFLTSLLEEHLKKIIEDYEKLDGEHEPSS